MQETVFDRCPLCNGNSYKVVSLTESLEGSLVRCLTCGLIRLHPMPAPDKTAALYECSDYMPNRLQAQSRYMRWENQRDDRFARIVNSPPGPEARLLDVGCATGTFLNRVRAKGWQVEGVEAGEHLAWFARERYGLNVHTGQIEDVLDCFEFESFDVITLWDVIEHLRQPIEVLNGLYRILKPGGNLYLATPNADGWVAQFHLHTLACWWGIWPHPEPPYHLYQFSRKSLVRALRKVGFVSIELMHDEIPLWYTVGFPGEPNLLQWLQEHTRIPHGRLVYILTLPVYWGARLARRGDSMIAVATRSES